MRRLHFGLLAAGLPLLALSLTLAGCSPATTSSGTVSGDKSPPDTKTTDKGSDWKPLEPAKGVITGKVMLKGDPKIEKLNADLAAKIEANQNKKMCKEGASPEELEEQGYRVKDGKVANVFVWIQPAEKNTYFKIDNPKEWATPLEIVQPHCAFIPHAAVVFPVYRDPKDPTKWKKTEQKLSVKNTATESHNTKYGDPNSTIKGDNKILQPGESMPLVIEKLSDQDAVTLSCNIHPWMDAHLKTFDHPFATVTDKDGNFKISKVPTGVKLKIFAWHEKAGALNDKGEEIEVTDGKDAVKDFTLEVK